MRKPVPALRCRPLMPQQSLSDRSETATRAFPSALLVPRGGRS